MRRARPGYSPGCSARPGQPAHNGIERYHRHVEKKGEGHGKGYILILRVYHRGDGRHSRAAAGYGLDDFKRLVSISSFVSIKALVASGIGISFLYRSVVENEPDIGTFTVDGITEPHPFHVVYTQGTNAKNYARQFLAGTDGPG